MIRSVNPGAEVVQRVQWSGDPVHWSQLREGWRMAFKRRTSTDLVPEDPEQLYRQLALTNDGPENLWAHQADVLRSWHGSNLNASDVAIELPTGAGKTLVGGLIGEFRRRVARERVAYLCPTRQLARQTAGKLDEYGIPNVLLIGDNKLWDAADYARYNSGRALAVSVYSHVFNTNSALGNTQLLLLDDAHAAEGYVAGPWRIQIDREVEETVYQDVLALLVDALDPLILNHLRATDPDGQFRNSVYLASPSGVAKHATALESALNAAVTTRTINKKARYAWRFLQGHLDRCLLYVSYRQILIRPLIAPTSTHTAFSAPDRRIYMSATLGSGGELERSFGRRAIKRIPIPKGWEKQGTGRRLFSFPQLTDDFSSAPDLLDAWVAKVIADHGRAIVLTPDTRTADSFIANRLPTGYPVLKAADVEDDLTIFTGAPAAALVLNNRYDGIDLPDDDCRLVVLDGLPARGDLQERFLHGSLGALEVLQERIRARIMQGAGRATRNARDWANVLVLGDDLIPYVTQVDVQQAMHPEIHAELEFGYEQSIDITADDMLDQIEVFDEHERAWRQVDEDIVAARETYERIEAPGTAELQKAVRHEVAAWEAIWHGEWEHALTLVRQVIDDLRGGRASQRYAALWHYLAGCIALRLAQSRNDDASLREAAARYFTDARTAGRGTTWQSHLAAPADSAAAPSASEIDPLDQQAINGVLANAGRLNKPSVFDQEVTRARDGLANRPRVAYEAALVVLGQLTGADPSYGDGGNDTAPDAVWIFGDVLWVAWEAKSEAKPDGELGSDDVRQAGGHTRFAAGDRGVAAPGDSSVLLVTPQERIHNSARRVAEDHVYLVRPQQVLDVFDRVVRAWRLARSQGFTALSSTDLASIFASERALPSQWLKDLRAKPLRSNASIS